MLQILGVGHAFPETILETDPLVAQRTGILQCCSSLPLEYIKQTNNLEPKQAKSAALCTPTDLAFAACEMALKRAGIGWEQIGLIIGDGSPPHQTTPSEAQRVGNRAGIKIPAYDSAALSGAMVFHLHTLNCWRPERVADYVLCLSANTPTKMIDYSMGDERYYFGDAAGAMVLSKKHKGRFQVAESVFGPVSGGLTNMRFQMDGHLRAEMESEILRVAGDCTKLAQKFNKQQLSVVDAQLGRGLSKMIIDGAGLQAAKFISNYEKRGYSLGSSPITALSEQWDNLAKDQPVLVLGSGTGSGAGYVLLEQGGQVI